MTKKLIALVALGLAAAPASAATIVLNNIGTTTTPEALKGFRIAANYWESQLTNNVVLTLNVGLDKLPPNVLGSTRSSFTSKAVVNIENRIKAFGTTALDAQVTTNLPTLSNGILGAGTALKMYTPGYTGIDDDGNPFGIDNATRQYDADGSYNNSVIGLTTANAKALGYAFAPGSVDGQILFSSEFGFDFDPRNGVDAGKSDFIGVAIHEIGHALGFVSGVDDYDVYGTGGRFAQEVCFADGTLCQDYPANDDWFGETLDLFRYSGKNALDWTPGANSYFSLDRGATAFGGGFFSSGEDNGDGWQASHWQAPRSDVDPTKFTCRKPFLGVMNPYLCDGSVAAVTALDLAAFDAIGWNTKTDVLANPNYRFTSADAFAAFGVPEPAMWGMMIAGFGMVGFTARRRRPNVRITYA